MTADQRPSKPQPKLGLDPAEALMDYLGQQRDRKLFFNVALLSGMSPDIFERFKRAVEAKAKKKINRPQVHWDTVQDFVLITFRAGTDYSKRVVLDERRLLDHDAEGNFAGVVLRNVSEGVTVNGLPEDRRISRMLRRRDINVMRTRTAFPNP